MKFVFLLYIFFGFSSSLFASVDKDCGSLSHLLKKFSGKIKPDNLWFSLWADNEERYIVIISAFDKRAGVEGFVKKGDSEAVMPWLILESGAMALSSKPYCIKAFGDTIEHTKSIHNNGSTAKFGLPGSGFPRCLSKDKSSLGTVEMGLWANKYVGEALIYHLHADDITFRLVAGSRSGVKDLKWVLIEHKNDLSESCVVAMGSSLIPGLGISIKELNKGRKAFGKPLASEGKK